MLIIGSTSRQIMMTFSIWILIAACLMPEIAAGEDLAFNPDPNGMDYQSLQRGCLLAAYPSSGLVHVAVDLNLTRVRLNRIAQLGQQVRSVEVKLLPQSADHVLASVTMPVTNGTTEEKTMAWSGAKGKYLARYEMRMDDNNVIQVDVPFVRDAFPWEGNSLGITEQVYKPFLPVKTDGMGKVDIVGREYQLNSLGLLDSLVSLDQELLAGRMTLMYELASGQKGQLKQQSMKLVTSTDNQTVYIGQATSPVADVQSTVTVEFDGMIKLEWTLSPGVAPEPIERLWLDIPLKTSAATLMHNVTDSNRIHHIGLTPVGEGVVWTSSDARRQADWQNTFNAYLWLGNETRGLAWFAENDRDWLTEHNKSTKPIQQVVRNGNVTHIQVNFINKTSTLNREHHIVFGIQASPTKPRPTGWRAMSPMPPAMSGPVNGWGAIQCAAKSPYHDAWEVVDQINLGRQQGKVDEQWFKDWAVQNNPPLVHGRIDWLERTMYIAKREASRGTKNATLTYFEEMRASTIEAPWQTFQDEWGNTRFTDRQWPDESVMRRGFNASPYATVSFPKSYRDMGAYYANEWLKRGVGLYWDNTYPQVCYDPQTSAAYVTEEGSIQPALSLWNQRAYQKRIWNILQENRKTAKVPLEWSVHMTTTLLLPLHTFATKQLDYELNATEPASPDFIRTTMLGTKCGNLPYALKVLAGNYNPILKPLSKTNIKRIEWGMRRVHELAPAHDPGAEYHEMEAIIHGFGYGEKDVINHRYWDESPVARVDKNQVEWLVIHAPQRQQAMIILASWDSDKTDVLLTMSKDLGMGDWHYMDAETGQSLDAVNTQSTKVTLASPYGVRILLAYQSTEKPAVTWTLRDPAEIQRDLQPDQSPKGKATTKPQESVMSQADPNRGIEPQRVLIRDDFEKGINSQWTTDNGPTVAQVTMPDGKLNHVLRFSDARMRLLSPPFPDAKLSPEAITEDLHRWENYAVRFRFRLGPITSDLSNPSMVTTFFRLDWRTYRPTVSHPSEYKLIYVQANRPRMAWRIDGPRIAWNDRQDRFKLDQVTLTPNKSGFNYAIDQNWHEIEVRTVGNRTQVDFDGKLISDGSEDRAPYGGIGITTLWNDRTRPQFMDIDDIVVWQIDNVEQPIQVAKQPIEAPIYASPVRQEPVIDGKLDDQVWKNLRNTLGADTGTWYRYFNSNDDRIQPPFGRKSWVAFDQNNLFIAMEAQVPDVMSLRHGTPGNPFAGDGIEIHLRSESGLYLHYGIDITNIFGPGVHNNVTDLSAIRHATFVSDHIWSCEIAIPWKVIQVDPSKIPTLELNLGANKASQGNGIWQPLTITPQHFDILRHGRKLLTQNPPMKVTMLPDVSSKPVVDGKLDDRIWQQLIMNGYPICNWQKSDGANLSRPRNTYVASDTDNLYVAVVTDLSQHAGVISSQGQSQQGDNLRLDFERFALGVDALGKPLEILLPYQIPFSAAVSQTNNQLIIEMAIPWSQIGGFPGIGNVVHMGLSGHDSIDGYVSSQPTTDPRDEKYFRSLIILP